MSEIGDAIQDKCLAFGDRVIKLNDYLLEQAVKTSSINVPVYLRSVASLSNQLLRAGTSIGANNAEAISAISNADFRSKSFIALKEARESLYWINLLYRNNFLDCKQYESIYSDCEEIVKILTHRCKKMNEKT